MEIEQTARLLETNAHVNFPMAENADYQCMENCGRKHTHIETFVAHCASSGTMLRQSQRPRRVPSKHAECFLSIVHRTNAEQRYHLWGQLTLFYHKIVRRGPPSLYRQLHVNKGNIRHVTYGYTKWTCSQSLTVLERNISDLEA